MSAAEKRYNSPIAVRPADACRMIGIGKTRFYELVKAGDLRPYKLGRATLIDVADLHAYLDRMKGGRAA